MPPRIIPKIWLARFNTKYGNFIFHYKRSKFKGAKDKIWIFHYECGRYFLLSPQDHWEGKGCNYIECIRKKISMAKTHTHEQAKAIFRKVHGKRYIYNGNYTYDKDPDYEITCRTHGNFKMMPKDHKQNHECPKCADIQRVNSIRHTLKRVLLDIKKCDILDEYDLSLINEYIGNKEPLIFIHKECGKQFSMSSSDFKSGYRCSHCNSSKGEKMLLAYIISRGLKPGVNFFTQKTFKDCKLVNVLRFDGYINININYGNFIYKKVWLIEYDGIQHFEIVDRFQKISGFIARAKCDLIKNKWAREHNICCIRIPHTIKTQEQFDIYMDDKLLNWSLDELNEHNKKLEEHQQKVIRNALQELEELEDSECSDDESSTDSEINSDDEKLAKNELKEIIHLLKF